MDNEIKFYNEILISFGKILVLLQLIPISVGILKWRYLNKPLKIFWYFCTTYFIIDLFVQILIWFVSNYYSYVKSIVVSLHIKDFSFTGILYFLNNFSLLGYFYFLVLKKTKLSPIIKWISIILWIVSLINYLFIEGYTVVGIFNPTADAIYCFVLPCIFMWYLYNENGKVPLSKNPYFWINLRFLIPNLISLVFKLFGNKIQNTDSLLFVKIGILQNGIWLVGLIFACIGFYYARYTKYLSKPTTL